MCQLTEIALNDFGISVTLVLWVASHYHRAVILPISVVIQDHRAESPVLAVHRIHRDREKSQNYWSWVASLMHYSQPHWIRNRTAVICTVTGTAWEVTHHCGRVVDHWIQAASSPGVVVRMVLPDHSEMKPSMLWDASGWTWENPLRQNAAQTYP